MTVMPVYVDTHLHLADYLDYCAGTGHMHGKFAQPALFCFSAHDRTEFKRHQAFLEQKSFTISPAYIYNGIRQSKQPHILFSFGIHPQKPVIDEAEFLYRLLETRQIQAIGECGFDLFNDDYKRILSAQQKIWNMQLDLAQQFQVPLIIHCRKALALIFESVPKLKKLPSVIFHGWGGSPQEALSLLKKGVNAYFSIGKAVLRGQKSVCAMAARFDIRRLLTETDAPYMNLKAEPFSHPHDIVAVTARCAELRKFGDDLIKQYTDCSMAMDNIPVVDEELNAFLDVIVQNFNAAFGLPNL